MPPHDRLQMNATDLPSERASGIPVLCAWPVSGQYGLGSRILCYMLVAACLIARNDKRIKSASLVGILLFPAVAALHAITLAAFHNPDAVDMDIYGAFQLCSLGTLIAPLILRLSRTYFDITGRNILFLWFCLMTAGLLSLTVEFARVRTYDCTQADSGSPLAHVDQWGYGDACGLACTEERGPFSPMRRDAASNIYVIPAPSILSLRTAKIFCACCCILPILSILSIGRQIFEMDRQACFGRRTSMGDLDRPIEGTKNATPITIKGIQARIRVFLIILEPPILFSAILAVLIIGERNLFSTQVSYQTEPMTSIGQWAPLAGGALALFEALHLRLNGKRKSHISEDLSLGSLSQRPLDHSPRRTEDPSPSSVNEMTRNPSSASLERTTQAAASSTNTPAVSTETPLESSLDDSSSHRGRATGISQIAIGELRNSHLQQIDGPRPSQVPSNTPSIRSATGRSRSMTA